MKQITKLKICDRVLLFLTVIVLASGLQLELLHGCQSGWIWLHIIICFLFMLMCGYHIYLHFRWNNWFRKIRGQRSQLTRILWWVAILTLLSGIIATVHRLCSSTHTPIGGIHGKIGFLMIVLVVAHALKRHKFYYIK